MVHSEDFICRAVIRFRSMLVNLQEYIGLWRMFKARLSSPEEYRKMQAFQATLLIRYLRSRGVEIAHKKILDLGCGLGGYSTEIAKHTCGVVGIDLSHLNWRLKNPPYWVVANALSIPAASEAFDLVICASLIEHVQSPLDLLQEIRRVLKKGGYCYLGFPPFHSPRGGHEFSPFHYLGEKWALRLRRFQAGHPQWVETLYHAVDKPASFSRTFEGWGLFPLTIKKAKRLVKEAGFKTLDISARYMPVNVSRSPLIGEFLTFYVQFLLLREV